MTIQQKITGVNVVSTEAASKRNSFPVYDIAKPCVVMFHCSGGNGGQWRDLAQLLSTSYTPFAADQYGTHTRGPWHGRHAYSLAEEASQVVEFFNFHDGPVHLVGHSFGAAVALEVALRCRDKIASINLYETTNFHLLEQMGGEGGRQLSLVKNMVSRISEAIAKGDCWTAIESFYNYWNGVGQWSKLDVKIQDALLQWVPKTPLDFHALFTNKTRAEDFANLHVPTLLIKGEVSPLPALMITDYLAETLSDVTLKVIEGAGHMGPITHGAKVNAHILDHINRVSQSGTAHGVPAN